MILLEEFGLSSKFARTEQLLELVEHTLADTGNGEHLLGIVDDVSDLLRVVLDCLGRVSVGADAEGILPVDFQQVGGFKENIGYGLVVHSLQDKQREGWGARADTLLRQQNETKELDTKERLAWRRVGAEKTGERDAWSC